MPRLEEGGLTFDFPNDGSDASRYDAWSFYRNQFQRVCGGAKAVDDADERRISDRALTTGNLGVVLRLEQPAVLSKLFPRVADPANLTQKLKQLLKPVDPHPRVVDGRDGSMPWTVTPRRRAQ